MPRYKRRNCVYSNAQTTAPVMALFDFAFGRPRASDDVEMGETGSGDRPIQSAGQVAVPASQATLPGPHVYPPFPQPTRDTKPIPRSLRQRHDSPQTPTTSHHESCLTPTPSRTFLCHPSHQTSTQSSGTSLCHPSPQTPTQSSAFTPARSTDNAVAIRRSDSARRRMSDAEDPFAPEHGGEKNRHKATPVTKCRVMEIEDPNKEKVIQSQAALIQMLRDQLAKNNDLMQTLREEIKERDAESLTKQHEYEARIQEVEARVHQGIKGRLEEHTRERQDDMELITPEVAATLGAVAQKQKGKSLEDSKRTIKIRYSAGQQERTSDVEMDSDGDRRDAGTIEQEFSSPRPASRSVPKPMSYKKPRGGKIKLKTNPPVPPRLFLDESDGEEFPSSNSDHFPTSPPRRPPAASSSSNRGVEEKLDMLLTMLQGTPKKNFQAMPPTRRTMHSSIFHTPISKGPKPRGRNETLTFVRKHLHSLLGIEHTADIAKYSDEIFATDTPMQRKMAAYEEHGYGQPNLEPMRINWKDFNGRWNETLCERFVQHCVKEGLGEGDPNEDELQLVANMFWERLGRIRAWINLNAPKKNETADKAEIRNAERHRSALEAARRNTRRQHSYSSRVDTCLSYLPEEGEPIDESTAAWQDHLTIIETLGAEGQSSDESDEEDPNVYNVRILPWRSRELVNKVSMTDKARNTTNAYGNPRPGNRPRNRKRRRDAKQSQRKAPRGKPLNYYDREWYNGLTHGQKRALGALPKKPFLDTSFDDSY